jgi:hypothetical protein
MFDKFSSIPHLLFVVTRCIDDNLLDDAIVYHACRTDNILCGPYIKFFATNYNNPDTILNIPDTLRDMILSCVCRPGSSRSMYYAIVSGFPDRVLEIRLKNDRTVAYTRIGKYEHVALQECRVLQQTKTSIPTAIILKGLVDKTMIVEETVPITADMRQKYISLALQEVKARFTK